MNRTSLLLFALLALPMVASTQAKQAEIILGVLEHNEGHYSGEKPYHAVRAVFKKENGEWQPFPSSCPDQECLKLVTAAYPAGVKWTIVFDGKTRGQLSTQNPDKFKFYGDVGLQTIIGTPRIPTVGEPSDNHLGLYYSSQKLYRPLIAVSQPNYKDPDRWKPTRPKAQLATLAKAEFLKKFPKAIICDENEHALLDPWFYHASDIEILESYSSNKNWTIMLMRLKEHEPSCGMIEANDPFNTHWFVVNPAQKVSYLCACGFLVDAGDYDNDGKSELVFGFRGYQIYYDDFRKHSVFAVQEH